MRERIQRLRQRHARIRPVQQQQVDLGDAQLVQALLGGAFEVMWRKVTGPDFCGDEHLVAGNAGGAQRSADLALVLVDLRGVDMAIAEPQRLLDQPRAGPPAQLPGAEPDRRDFCVFCFDELHRWLSGSSHIMSREMCAC